MRMEDEERLWDGRLLSRTVHARLDGVLYRKMVKYCKRKGIPASLLVRSLLKDFLDPRVPD